MAKYISNRLKNLTIGLDSYSENLTSLNIIGDVKVGAGVTISSSAGIVTAVGFKKVGGTNSQFMMADGSVNSSTFLTAESDTLDTILTRGNTTTKSLSVGVATASRLEISSTFPRILLTDTNNNDDFSIDNADGTFRVRDRTNSANRFEIASNGKATLHNDVEIEGGLEVDGNISVGGTITYNDVTNVDSIGIITARKDIHVGAGLSVVGMATATTFSGSGASLTNLPAGQLTGTLPAISGENLTNVVTTDGGGQTTNIIVTGISSLGIGTADDATQGQTDLYHEGILRLKTTSLGVQVVGVMSATALDFTGATGAFANDVLFQGSSHSMNWDKSESYLQFNDGAKAVFGTDITAGDLEIFHSGQQSYISENGTGDLLLITGAVGLGSTAIKISDGASTIYYQGAERLRTTSTGIILTGTVTGSIDGNAATATKATDLNIDATQQLVIQTGNDATDVLASGTAGYVLQSNGSGNAPTWAASAPANAITGITVREDGGLVGSANSVSTINFTGAGVGVTFTNPVAGIATVTISAGGGEDSSAVMLSMIFG